MRKETPTPVTDLLTRQHIGSLRRALEDFRREAEKLCGWGQTLARVLGSGGRLLVAGNGGSAAEAQHLTGELVGRMRADRRPYSAIALTADTSSLTAIGNDYGYEEVFARQVRAHGRRGDILITLSTSGASPNLLAAQRAARAIGMTSWALTGQAPNPLAGACDDALAVPSPDAQTVQELHLVSVHLLCRQVEAALSGEASRSARPLRLEGEQTMRGPVVVVGDVLLDRDVTGVADRLCPDAPVPVLTETSRTERPGGAGLAASFLSLDGMDVVLIGATGTDEAGERVRLLLAELGVGFEAIPYDGCTPEKVRFKAQGHPMLRLDRGVELRRLGEVPEAALGVLHQASAVLVSDYGRGVTALPAVRRELADLAGRVPLVWDPHPKGSTPIPGARLVSPNRAEAATFSAAHGADLQADAGIATVAAEAWLLRSAWRVNAVAVTMGSDGALLAEEDCAPVAVPAHVCHGGDTCGAGDRFSAEAMLLLASGHSVRDAVSEAVNAASAYVANDGPASLMSELALKGMNR